MNAPLKVDPIAAMMPWESGEKQKLRQRLLNYQQRAGSRARDCEDDRARSQWWLACDLAQEAVFAPATAEHLEERLTTITHIAHSANVIERWGAEL